MGARAVFLDRDGVIAPDVHYCSRVEDFRLYPFVPDAVKRLNDAGLRVIIVTNQSGIARKYFTVDTLNDIHRKMKDELARGKAHIDGIYYCPHHPDDKCDCRKPKTGMFEQAVKDFDIDLPRSFVVGDSPTDIGAGKALGCKTILISNSNYGKKISCSPDCISKTLYAAVRWILGVLWLETG